MNNLIKLLLALIFGSISISPALARNSCDLSIQPIGETRVDDYNALSRQIQLEQIRLRLRNNGNRDCVGRIVFRRIDGDGRLIGPQGAMLDYLIVDERNFNQQLFDPRTARQNGLSIRVKANSTREIRPRLFVKRNQFGISGTYRSTIEAVFQPRGRPDNDSTALVRLAANVIPGVQANFVGISRGGRGNAASVLRLGEIEPGMRRTLGLQLRSNTDVDVEVSSRNRGRLLRRARDAGSIGYQMNIGGSTVDLGTASSLVLPARVERRGRTSRIEIQVENFENAPAGQYGDTILFRISAR